MHCFKCGAELTGADSVCRACGARVGEGVASPALPLQPPPLPPLEPVPTAPLNAPPDATTEVARYAGFWRRVPAAVIDGFVQAGLMVLIVLILKGTAGNFASTEAGDITLAIVYYLLSISASWLYFALMHSSRWQATLGKRALGIKVTSLSGERIGFGRATGRHFGWLLSWTLLGIGYLMAAFTSRKQALHDLMAGTLVVSRNTMPAGVAAGLAAPKLSGGVIAAAVLAAFVAVVGMLAAIGIPAYQEYTLRMQVITALEMAEEYKVAVSKALSDGIHPEAIDNEAIGLPETPASEHVSRVIVGGSVIQVTFGGAAGAALQERSVTLVPGIKSDGEIVWICGMAAVPAGVTALLDDHGDYTDVEPKYLPSTCR
jgi:uncharacterized RDD family membrane protein YckC/Tfp pilus assembly major pilin PilA